MISARQDSFNPSSRDSPTFAFGERENPLMLKRIGSNRNRLVFAMILVNAAALRGWNAGSLSYWYDEVVSVRLAESTSLSSLLSLLDRIDATRAPLQPILLRVWIRTIGRSEAEVRGFSLVCDLLAIVLIARIARRLYGEREAVWAAWLATICPNLIAHARDARMYSFLTLTACLSWNALFAIRERKTLFRSLALASAQTALAYAHPLGLLMIFAQTLAAPILFRSDLRAWKVWSAGELALSVCVAPWLPKYFDHPPEYLLTPLPLKYLIGTPIGFVGGDFFTLLLFGGAIAWGLIRTRSSARFSAATACWLIVPPIALYVYSRTVAPLFGPERYTLFVAPAFLILLAVGLVRLPKPARWALALLQLVVAGRMLATNVYSPDRRADWRAASRWIKRHEPGSLLIVLTEDPKNRYEAEVARYYLNGSVRIASPAEASRLIESSPLRTVLTAVGLRDGKAVANDSFPGREGLRKRDVLFFPGLKLDRYQSRPARSVNVAKEARPFELPSTKGVSRSVR